MLAATEVTDNADARATALADQLLRDGYLIVPQAVDAELHDALHADFAPQFEEAPFSNGLFYGETTKRFGRLLARSGHAAGFVLNDSILPIVRLALGDAGGIQLNLSQAIEIYPGAPVQVPHRDHEMWPVEKHGAQFMVNVMWPLDDFTIQNGATRIWPGSHLSSEQILPEHEAIDAVAPRGSAILFLGSTLHSGGANRSARPRRGMIFSYCQGWLLPDENPWLAYPPEVARSFAPELAELLGYRQRFAGLNNFEGQCPSVLLNGDRERFYPFADHLDADQNSRVQAYYDGLEAASQAA